MKTKSIVVLISLVIIAIGGYYIVNDGQEAKNSQGDILSENLISTPLPVYDKVDAEKFNNGIGKKNTVILDVRTLEEFMDGHIEGARNYDFYETDFEDRLNSLDKNAIYYIYCRSGNRSSQTVTLMKELGFMNVVELQGGIASWVGAGYSLSTECC